MAGPGEPDILADAGDGDAPGQHVGRGFEPVPGKQQAQDEHDVEQDRRGGGGGEPVGRVEHPAHHRDDRHAQQVGQGQPGQQDRGVEQLRPRGVEARRYDQQHLGHEDFDDDREDRETEHQDGKDPVGKLHRLVAAVPLEPFREHRHKGGGKGALGGEAAEHVGEAERDDERFDHADRAQIVRHQDIAHEAENPARQGPERHDGGGAEQLHEPSPCDASGV